MRTGRASFTAQMVAFIRAAADAGATTVPGFSDPVAARMLAPAARWLLRRSLARLAAMDAAARRRTVAQLEGITLRVATIDQEICAAAASGARQLVILGAGFDTRAWRLGALAGTTVFEVDHPSTQASKRQRIAELPALAADVRFVAVDFTRDSLPDALAAAGHAADQPTVWVWEGVTMYLADDALRATLAAIRARSADGSVALVHYHEPPVAGTHGFARRWAFRLVGEPQIGLRPRAALAAELVRAGFRVERDTNGPEQARLLGAEAPAGIALVSRIAVAAPAERPSAACR